MFIGVFSKFKINGKSKISSISKIKKIIESKKKWTEKGLRDRDWGVNPHSKGEPFSSSVNLFILRAIAKRRRHLLIRRRTPKTVTSIKTKKII